MRGRAGGRLDLPIALLAIRLHAQARRVGTRIVPVEDSPPFAAAVVDALEHSALTAGHAAIAARSSGPFRNFCLDPHGFARSMDAWAITAA